MSQLSALRQYVSKLLLSVAGVLVALLVLEIGFRAAGVSYWNFSKFDQYTGATLRPNAEAWRTEENTVYVRINSDGLRDREHSKEKPPNTLRIAVLGDSFAEAMQVELESAFWRIMERELSECPTMADATVEAINFGVSGYGTAQEIMVLRYRAWDYEPDIVVLSFTALNDVRNNSRELEGDSRRPYFYYNSDGKLELDASFRETQLYRSRNKFWFRSYYWLHDHSRVLQVARNGVVSLRELFRRHQETDGSQVIEAGLLSSVYLEPADPILQEAWRVTEGLLLLMRDEVLAKGAELLIVTTSIGPEVNPDPQVSREIAKRLGVDNLLYSDLRIKRLGEREGIPVLNLTIPFQQYAREHNVYLHGFGDNLGGGHWNEAGHQLVGKLIAQKLCPEFLH